MPKGLAELPRIPWRPEFAADPVPHLVRGYQTHGPVFGLDVPDADPGMIFLIGPEANERVLTGVEIFSWGPVYKPVRKAWGEDNFIAMDGPPHDMWRKLIQPGVTGGALIRQFDMMREVITRHVEQWSDRVVDIHEPLRHVIFEIAARAFCGITDPNLMAEFTAEYENMMGSAVDPMVEASFAMDAAAGARVRKLLHPLILEARERTNSATSLRSWPPAPTRRGGTSTLRPRPPRRWYCCSPATRPRLRCRHSCCGSWAVTLKCPSGWLKKSARCPMRPAFRCCVAARISTMC